MKPHLQNRHRRFRGKVWPVRQSGMSLVEVLFAMAILLITMAGTLPLLIAAISTNQRNKLDTQAVLISQMFIEQMSSAGAIATSTSNVTIKDCTGSAVVDASGNAVTIKVEQCASSGGCGCPLKSGTQDIDWSQAQSTCVDVSGNTNYAYYTACGTSGRQPVYEIRWSQTPIYNSHDEMLVVSTRLKNGSTQRGWLFSIPATLHTVYPH